MAPSIIGNTIEDAAVGIRVYSGARPVIQGNTFCRNGTDLSAPSTFSLDGNTVCAGPSASP